MSFLIFLGLVISYRKHLVEGTLDLLDLLMSSKHFIKFKVLSLLFFLIHLFFI